MAEPKPVISTHALVFGASGLVGWGVVDQLMENYPTEGTFSKVTALVNRPFTLAESYWPSPSASRPELELVSNIDLTQGTVEEFTALLEKKVPDIASVTHVFYFAYKPEQDTDLEVKTNRGMLERAIGALNGLSPKLKFVVFPSGTKAYGIQIPGGVFTAPYKESMGRLPEPAASIIFYYVGFVPNGSAFNLPGHWANYLSTYALVEGDGAQVPFPGTSPAYFSLFNEASAETIARFSIWASLHPEKAGGGQTFNIADQAQPASMSARWPALAKYFGLEGVGPVDDDDGKASVLKPGEYTEKHRRVLEERGVKGNEVFAAEFLDSYGYYLDFDRQLSLDKAREAGFEEEIDPKLSWFKAFDRLRKAGMIPG